MRTSRLISTAILGLGAIGLGALSLSAVAVSPAMAQAMVPQKTARAASPTEMEDGLIDGATRRIDILTTKPSAGNLLRQAKGVFIIPNEATPGMSTDNAKGKGALKALLLKRNGSSWSEPAFMRVASVAHGPETGAGTGEVVMLLMSDRAMHDFAQAQNLSLNSAGLKVDTFSRTASNTDGDIVVWSNRSVGASGAAGGISGISTDPQADQTFYRTAVSTADILNGHAPTEGAAKPLQSALPG